MYCLYCGAAIVADAQFCKACGRRQQLTPAPTAKQQPDTLPLWLAAIGGLLLVIVIIGSIVSNSGPSQVVQPQPPAESEKDAAAKALRDDDFARAAKGAGSILHAARDPDTLEFKSILVMEDSRAICYVYRAQNAFGGFIKGHAVLTRKAKYLNTSAALWNAQCAGKNYSFDFANTMSIACKAGLCD